MNRQGKFHADAFVDCFRALQPQIWRYVFTLQNHDFPLRLAPPALGLSAVGPQGA